MAQVNNQAQTNFPVLIQSMQDAQTCLTQMTQAIFALGLTLGTCQNHLSLSMSKALDCNDHSAQIKTEPASDERSSHMDPFFLQSELQQCRTLNRSLHERIIELELQLEDKMSTYNLDDDAQSLRFNDEYNRLCREGSYARNSEI